jgi:hypothetical protein
MTIKDVNEFFEEGVGSTDKKVLFSDNIAIILSEYTGEDYGEIKDSIMLSGSSGNDFITIESEVIDDWYKKKQKVNIAKSILKKVNDENLSEEEKINYIIDNISRNIL